MEKRVEEWLGDFKESTGLLYRNHFNIFLKWVKENKIDVKKIDNRIVKDYLLYSKGIGWTINTRKTALAVLRSYCKFVDRELKEFGRSEINKLLEPSENDIKKAHIERPLRIEEIKNVLVWGYEPYKTILTNMDGRKSKINWINRIQSKSL